MKWRRVGKEAETDLGEDSAVVGGGCGCCGGPGRGPRGDSPVEDVALRRPASSELGRMEGRIS